MRYVYAAEILLAILTVWAVVLIDTRRAALERRAHGDQPDEPADLDTDTTRGTLDELWFGHRRITRHDLDRLCTCPNVRDLDGHVIAGMRHPDDCPAMAEADRQYHAERLGTWTDAERPTDHYRGLPVYIDPGHPVQPDPYPELDPDHPDAIRHRRLAHVCTYACMCPIHEIPAVYSHTYGDHACQQVTCQYGGGGLLRVT